MGGARSSNSNGTTALVAVAIVLVAFATSCVWWIVEVHGLQTEDGRDVRMRAAFAAGAFVFVAAALGLTVIARQSRSLLRASRARDRERRRRFHDRAEALVAMSRGLAHEINNPLSFVGSNVTHLQLELEEKGALNDELRQVFAETREGLDRIRKVVAELQAVTRGHAADRAVDVRQAIESSAWILRHFIAPRAALEVQLDEVPRAAISGAELSMVMTQLLTALVDPLPPHPSDPPVIRLRTVRDGALARVELVVPAAVSAAPLRTLVEARQAAADDEAIHGIELARQILERAGAQTRLGPAGEGEVSLCVTLPPPEPASSTAENE